MCWHVWLSHELYFSVTGQKPGDPPQPQQQQQPQQPPQQQPQQQQQTMSSQPVTNLVISQPAVNMNTPASSGVGPGGQPPQTGYVQRAPISQVR